MTYFKKVKPNVFDKIVELLEEEGEIKRTEEFLGTPEFEICKDAVYERVSRKILATLKNAKYDFVRYSEIEFQGKDGAVSDDILNILLEEKRL